MRHNLHRDFVTQFAQGLCALLDRTGAILLEYKYDVWGKFNLIRSRGNIDEETKPYHIQDRYFAPERMRFLNKDNAVLEITAGVRSANPFAYCKNDPIKFIDTNGEFNNMLSGAIAGGIVGRFQPPYLAIR